MSDSNENITDETEESSSLIGVDPLAWLSDEEKQTVLEQSKEQGAPVGEESIASEEENNAVEETVAASEELPETESNSAEETDKNSYTVNLESSVTIRDVAELMDELSFIDPSISEVIFECAQVEKTDAAALQLLTGYYLFAIEEGKTVVWNNPTEALCHAVNLLGLSDIINVSLAA